MPESSGQGRWRTYRRVPAAALIAAVLAYAASFAISPKYVADTHLLINGTTSYLSTPGAGPVSLPQLGTTDIASAMADTQAALTSSRDVAEAVVASLKLDDVAPVHRGPLGTVKNALSSSYRHVRGWLTYGSVPAASKHDIAVSDVQHALSAVQVKNSYVLDVSALWSDPKMAAALANAAADALVAQSKRRYDDEVTAYQTQLKGEVDKASAAQASAQAALSDYEAAHHISNVDAQLQLSAQNRSSMQQQADTLAAQLSSLQAQLASTEQSLAGTPRTISTSQDITTGRSGTSVSTTAQNPTYASLTTQAAQLRAQIDGAAAERASILTTMSATSESSKPLTAAQSELAQLALTSNVAGQNYSTLSAQYEQSLTSAATRNVEVSHVDAAAAPLLPVGPIRTMYLTIGLLLGALLSFLVVHARVLRAARQDPSPARGVIDLVELEGTTSIPSQVLSSNGNVVRAGHDTTLIDPSGD